MKEEKVYRSLGYVREEYLDSAADAMRRGLVNTRFRKPRVWIIAAACLALLGVIVVFPIIHIVNDPLFGIDEIELSASDLAELFDIQFLDAGGTKRYTKVTVDDPNSFALINENYLPIYHYDPTGKPIDYDKYKAITNGCKERLMEAIGVIENPFYEHSDSVEDDIITCLTNLSLPDLEEPFWGSIGTVQRLYSNEIDYYQDLRVDQRIHLYGELVAIHQGDSDEEIVASLSSIKEKLFTIFDDAFTDVKIVRYYGDNRDIAESIYVYFYNEGEHPFNADSNRPRSDFICLYFDNQDHMNGSSDLLSDDLLTQVNISYVKLRVPATELYGVIGKAKTLSLEKAEEYLSKGYVFGGYHACPICYAKELESMPLVNFTDYDYVDLEYVEDYSKGNEEKHYIIPFYAFYKYIGANDYGEALYAKTYVPAIEVEGIAEYFSHQS